MSASWRRRGALVEIRCPDGCGLAQVYRSRDGRLMERTTLARATDRQFRNQEPGELIGAGEPHDRPVPRLTVWQCRHGSSETSRAGIEAAAGRASQNGRAETLLARKAQRG